MKTEEMIHEINTLYHKSQAEGLTEEESKRQKELRKMYIANIRNNFRSQLDSITIEEADGTRVNLGEKYGNKK